MCACGIEFLVGPTSRKPVCVMASSILTLCLAFVISAQSVTVLHCCHAIKCKLEIVYIVYVRKPAVTMHRQWLVAYTLHDTRSPVICIVHY